MFSFARTTQTLQLKSLLKIVLVLKTVKHACEAEAATDARTNRGFDSAAELAAD